MSIVAVAGSAPVKVNTLEDGGATVGDDTALDDRVLRILRSEDEIVGSESAESSVLVELIEDAD